MAGFWQNLRFLHVHLDEIFGQAFGGVGEGGVVPIFNKQHEVFDYGVDFE